MKKSIFRMTILIITLLISTSSLGQSLEEQLQEIMEFWPGTYNNDKQIAEAKMAGKDIWLVDDTGEGGFLQLTSHYIKLDRPDIGDNVLYVEEYRDHDYNNPYRQRIYTLSIDKKANMIKVKMWPFKDKKKYLGSYKDITKLRDLKLEEITAFPDICDMHVKKQGDKYFMYMNGKDCSFGDKCFNYEVMLSKNVFSYHDKITKLSTGELLTTAANYEYHNLDRIK